MDQQTPCIYFSQLKRWYRNSWMAIEYEDCNVVGIVDILTNIIKTVGALPEQCKYIVREINNVYPLHTISYFWDDFYIPNTRAANDSKFIDSSKVLFYNSNNYQ